jgi:hypothetical protein
MRSDDVVPVPVEAVAFQIGPARGGAGAGCATARPQAERLGEEDPGGGGSHGAHHAAGGDALEHPHDGAGPRLSQATVQRIWKRHHLQPHRVETFKLSRDKHFLEKLTDVVGLYLNPPDKSLVLCVDEKSQIQALDRTQPGLPLRRGRCGTQTHDYKRNGTTTLFAALSVLDGTVIGDCMPRHRHQEFLRFLTKIDAEIPPGLALHLIVDNYGTHKHPRGERLAAPPSPFPSALHPDVELLVEPGRTVVSRSHGQTHPARQLRECARVDRCDQGLSRPPQPESPGLCLECARRAHPGQDRQM